MIALKFCIPVFTLHTSMLLIFGSFIQTSFICCVDTPYVNFVPEIDELVRVTAFDAYVKNNKIHITQQYEVRDKLFRAVKNSNK